MTSFKEGATGCGTGIDWLKSIWSNVVPEHLAADGWEPAVPGAFTYVLQMREEDGLLMVVDAADVTVEDPKQPVN